MKLLVGNSAIKISNLRLRFFEYKFFTFVTLIPSGWTGLILKEISKQKEITQKNTHLSLTAFLVPLNQLFNYLIRDLIFLSGQISAGGNI